ncbi:unnamed protein product [Amoebophrya sp. A120]|nr:unnamed protein product [Amoebophrya sp. A120]|eukprot:GSA120T00007531001.1
MACTMHFRGLRIRRAGQTLPEPSRRGRSEPEGRPINLVACGQLGTGKRGRVAAPPAGRHAHPLGRPWRLAFGPRRSMCLPARPGRPPVAAERARLERRGAGDAGRPPAGAQGGRPHCLHWPRSEIGWLPGLVRGCVPIFLHRKFGVTERAASSTGAASPL